MSFLFWISLTLILYTYAGYPLLIALLARLRPRPHTRAPWPAGSAPVSIIMPVHNGSSLVTAQVEHLLGLEPELVREVLVVSDGSTDGTDNLLTGNRKPRLKIFLQTTQGGKAVALNRAMEEAQGEILLFIDIRPRVESGAIAELLQNFADGQVGCVAGELWLGRETQDATTGAIAGLYWRYEQWIRTCEAAVDSPVGVYGGFYAVRRALAVTFPAGLILDDMYQPLSIIRQGYRSVIDRRAIVRDRWPGKTSGEFARKVRTLAGNFQLVRMAPWVVSLENRVAWQLVSHKLLRLVVPYCFIALLISTFALHFWLFGGLQCGFWILAGIAVRRRIPLLQRFAAPASALLVLNVAAVVGLLVFVFRAGPLWKMWVPTAPEPSQRAEV